MDTPERRRQFGRYLAGLRESKRWSQRQLSARLCALSGLVSVTRNEISRYERGERVPTLWLPSLAQVFGLPLATLERAAAYARGETDTPPPGITVTLADLLPDDEPVGPLITEAGARVGMTAVDALTARIHGLRIADDVLAGGDLIRPVFRELRSAVTLYRESSHTEAVGRALLARVAELGQLAGWIAADAGRNADAERAYRMGITAGRTAGDPELVGHVAGSYAYLLANTGRHGEGVAMARAAFTEAGQGAHPTARALSLDRIAWAHTQAGEPEPALRALVEAHEELNRQEVTEAPAWAYWVSREELEIMDARVYTELRRPLRAVPLLTEVLGRYDATHARELALYRSWLAIALIDANEPEQAAEEARLVLGLSAEVASERTAERSRTVLTHLQPFRSVKEVREVLDDYGYMLAG